MDIAFNFQRIDIVCDRYFQDSLKEQTRKMRGVDTNFEFSDDTPIPVDFRDDFLHNSQNKIALNEYLAGRIISLHSASKELRITYKDSVSSNIEGGQSNAMIASCTSKEVDQRLVRHAKDALNDGYKTVVIRTINTDVGKSDETIEFYDIRGIAAELRNNTQKALPFTLHLLAVTPCQVSLTRASEKFGMRGKQMRNTQILLLFLSN